MIDDSFAANEEEADTVRGERLDELPYVGGEVLAPHRRCSDSLTSGAWSP